MTGDAKHRLLVVDDAPASIRVIFKALGEAYDVTCALNAAEALEVAEKARPDLMLLDVVMPGTDGYALCQELKSREALRDVPVIFVTALDRPGDEERGLALGAVDYVTKPFVPAIVKLRVQTQIQLKLQRDALRKRTAELEAALSHVKQLEGIIPICMYCKKVRDDKNYWQRLEQFLTEHSNARVSHGMCPTCYEVQRRQLEEPSR